MILNLLYNKDVASNWNLKRSKSLLRGNKNIFCEITSKIIIKGYFIKYRIGNGPTYRK